MSMNKTECSPPPPGEHLLEMSSRTANNIWRVKRPVKGSLIDWASNVEATRSNVRVSRRATLFRASALNAWLEVALCDAPRRRRATFRSCAGIVYCAYAPRVSEGELRQREGHPVFLLVLAVFVLVPVEPGLRHWPRLA